MRNIGGDGGTWNSVRDEGGVAISRDEKKRNEEKLPEYDARGNFVSEIRVKVRSWQMLIFLSGRQPCQFM